MISDKQYLLKAITLLNRDVKNKYSLKDVLSYSISNPRINISVPSKDNNKLKAIGDIGEKIAYNFLNKKYKDVKWISKELPYNPYDLEFTCDGKKIYVEVKSTTDAVYDHFFLSRNEYDFYMQHKNNYWIIFITNISLDNLKNKTCNNLYIYKNPLIKIDMLSTGFENDNIYITPTNFKL